MRKMIRTIIKPGNAETIDNAISRTTRTDQSPRDSPDARPGKQAKDPTQPNVKCNDTQQDHQQCVQACLDSADKTPPTLGDPAFVLKNATTINASDPTPGTVCTEPKQ